MPETIEEPVYPDGELSSLPDDSAQIVEGLAAAAAADRRALALTANGAERAYLERRLLRCKRSRGVVILYSADATWKSRGLPITRTSKLRLRCRQHGRLVVSALTSAF
jgi:hypothetical protein